MNPVVQYFQAERAESIVFIAVGVVALAVAAWAWLGKGHAFLRGMAWPLAAIAAIQIVVGATVFTRSPQDQARVLQAIERQDTVAVKAETGRMQGVLRNFVVYRWVEAALLVAGVLAALLLPGPWARGLGTGLALQAALMLALDLVAERRGHVYLQLLAPA